MWRLTEMSEGVEGEEKPREDAGPSSLDVIYLQANYSEVERFALLTAPSIIFILCFEHFSPGANCFSMWLKRGRWESHQTRTGLEEGIVDGTERHWTGKLM